MTPGEFLLSFIVGFWGWASQECLAQGLSAVNSGTMAAFQNVAIVMGFLCDIYYFKREIFWSDYTGAGMIVLFTTL